MYSPLAVAVDPFNGNIYIADGDAIRVVTKSTGIITTIAVLNGYAGEGVMYHSFSCPRGINIDPSTGNLYIADTRNDAIRMITRSTGIVTIIAGTGQQGYSGDGGPATSAMLHHPNGIAVDATTGNIYIADTSNHVIRMVTVSTGIIITIAGNGQRSYGGDGGPATSAKLNFPSGVTVDASGNVIIADSGNNLVRMIAKSTGIITIIFGVYVGGYSGDGGPAIYAQFNFPHSVALDATSGMMYIVDLYNHVVRNIIGTPTADVSSPTMEPTVPGKVY